MHGVFNSAHMGGIVENGDAELIVADPSPPGLY